MTQLSSIGIVSQARIPSIEVGMDLAREYVAARNLFDQGD